MERTGHDPLALTRVPAKAAAEIAALAALGQGALALLTPEQSPREYAEALLRAELYPDAIRLLAFGLPRREAIWWAGLFVLWSGAGHLHAADASALRAVARWVVEPNEDHRQEAAACASKETPAGRVARAVARTGGSLRGPSLPAKAPGPDLPPKAVVSAVTLAVLRGEAKTIRQRQRQAVALGLHVARGHFLWTVTPPAPTRR
ncbi:MAG: hypothetical protein U0797_00080 [Gemmataceae bacterium]